MYYCLLVLYKWIDFYDTISLDIHPVLRIFIFCRGNKYWDFYIFWRVSFLLLRDSGMQLVINVYRIWRVALNFSRYIVNFVEFIERWNFLASILKYPSCMIHISRYFRRVQFDWKYIACLGLKKIITVCCWPHKWTFSTFFKKTYYDYVMYRKTK